MGFQNEVDEFYDEAEENVRLRLQNSSNRGYVENVDEVFGLSDSDDDYISEGSKKAKKKALKDASRKKLFYTLIRKKKPLSIFLIIE